MTPHSRRGIAHQKNVSTAHDRESCALGLVVVACFARGYDEKWTREVFVVNKVLDESDPVTYRVVDLADEPIDGPFYAQELQRIVYDSDAEFRLEFVIIRRRRRDVL